MASSMIQKEKQNGYLNSKRCFGHFSKQSCLSSVFAGMKCPHDLLHNWNSFTGPVPMRQDVLD
jgi:hypothetical protein